MPKPRLRLSPNQPTCQLIRIAWALTKVELVRKEEMCGPATPSHTCTRAHTRNPLSHSHMHTSTRSHPPTHSRSPGTPAPAAWPLVLASVHGSRRLLSRVCGHCGGSGAEAAAPGPLTPLRRPLEHSSQRFQEAAPPSQSSPRRPREMDTPTSRATLWPREHRAVPRHTPAQATQHTAATYHASPGQSTQHTAHR